MRQAFHLFVGRKTQGAPPWRVDTADGGSVETHEVLISGTCRAVAREGHPNYPFTVTGRGVVDVQADRVVITDCEV